MAATKYTYSINGDFPNHIVATTKLTNEIEKSAIVTALNHIETDDDVCDVWFDDALSGGDETILDGLVAAHDGVACICTPYIAPLVEYTSDHELVAGDLCKTINMNKATAITITIPKDSDVNFPIGASFPVMAGGVGIVTFAPKDGTVNLRSLNGYLSIIGQYAGATATKIGANEWLVTGALA